MKCYIAQTVFRIALKLPRLMATIKYKKGRCMFRIKVVFFEMAINYLFIVYCYQTLFMLVLTMKKCDNDHRKVFQI